MRTSALFGAKNSDFWNLWRVRTSRGIEPVRSFCGQGGRGQFFVILCDRP